MKEPAPVWRLGFRPFFFLAGIFGLIAILLWVFVFTGGFHTIGAFSPILWHAHEMIYGYATAVIAGFVLTASQNWTGRPGLRGRKLQVLVALWIAGRVAMGFSSCPGTVTAVIDLSFYPLLAWYMLPYLKPVDMRTERIFLVYFLCYFIGNLMMHLDRLGQLPGEGLRGALLGLFTTILMIIFMGGRVIPFFTESEKARSQPRVRSWLEILAHGSAWAFLLSQLLAPQTLLASLVAFSAAVIHLARLLGWQVRRIRRIPVLWVLHLAYLWIVLGFLLFGFASLGLVAIGAAVHAFAIGALGAMTYGMMSRVSLGHTGRKIMAPQLIVLGYILLNIAALIRVFGPVFEASRLSTWVQISGAAWLAAFILFVGIYCPILLAPRVDGKTG